MVAIFVFYTKFSEISDGKLFTLQLHSLRILVTGVEITIDGKTEKVS